MAEEKKMDIQEEKEGSIGANTVRFEIKKWNAIAMWSWDICSDTCAICRNSLNEPSIEYQVFGLLDCIVGFLKLLFLDNY